MSSQEPSLLAEVALRLAKSPEDVATEGLVYVLSRSETGRAFIQTLAKSWAPEAVRKIVVFRSQVGGEDSRPDIEAQDRNGAPVVIFENKFWAGLTDAQPGGYLLRLERLGGLLCFVVPESRMPALWPEVVRRAERSVGVLDLVRDEQHVKVARIGENRAIAMTSWFFLLGQLRMTLESHGDSILVADIRQLMGLAERMETSGFLPFTATDLTAPTARHMLQFCDIVDGVVERTLREPWANKKRLKATATRGRWGHYLKIRGYGCQLLFSAPIWAEHPESPIWLRVRSPEWQHTEAIELAIAASSYGDEAFTIQEGHFRGVWIPLRIPEGREYETVVAEMFDVVAGIGAALPKSRKRSTDDELPPDEEQP